MNKSKFLCTFLGSLLFLCSYTQSTSLVMANSYIGNLLSKKSYIDEVLESYVDHVDEISSVNGALNKLKSQLRPNFEKRIKEKNSEYIISKLEIFNVHSYDDDINIAKLEVLVRLFLDYHGMEFKKIPEYCTYACKLDVLTSEADNFALNFDHNKIGKCALIPEYCSNKLINISIK